MAKARKNNKKMGRGGRIALGVFAALLLATALVLGAGMVNASVVRVRRAEVSLNDLPAAFDGTTLLYASDIDLCGLNTGKKAGLLFRRLQSLKPDILLLGGDYTSPSVLDILNRPAASDESATKSRSELESFFYYIGYFDAPLGKYGLASPDDGDLDALRILMGNAGVRPLFNDCAIVERGGDRLYIAGISERSANLNAAGGMFKRGDCAIVASYGPDPLPILLTSEASDSGPWADLILSGSTHGGQIRLFGKDVLELSAMQRQYRSGWYTENGLPILATEGVGCEGANIRLGTTPEVWLVTVRRGNG